MDKKQKSTVFAIAVVFIISVIGFSLLSAYYNPLKKPEPPPNLNIQMTPRIDQRFTIFLNHFLANVNQSTNEYKSERKALVEIVSPRNLGQASYIEENHQLLQKLIPSLQAKMASVLSRFEEGEANVNELVSTEPVLEQQRILDQWRGLKKAYGKIYADYFDAENELIGVYNELMDFYYVNRTSITYDVTTNSFKFKNPADEIKEKEIKDRIKQLYAVQDEILKRSVPAPK